MHDSSRIYSCLDFNRLPARYPIFVTCRPPTICPDENAYRFPVRSLSSPRSLRDRNNTGERAYHCVLAGVSRELHRRLHLRAHRPFRESERLERLGTSLSNGLLRWLSPLNIGSVDVRGDDQQIGIKLVREQCGTEILIDHGLDAAQLAIFLLACRNAPASCTNHNAAFPEVLRPFGWISLCYVRTE